MPRRVIFQGGEYVQLYDGCDPLEAASAGRALAERMNLRLSLERRKRPGGGVAVARHRIYRRGRRVYSSMVLTARE